MHTTEQTICVPGSEEGPHLDRGGYKMAMVRCHRQTMLLHAAGTFMQINARASDNIDELRYNFVECKHL